MGYLVAKKTLLKKALEGLKIAGERPALVGEIALSYGADQIMPAKSIHDFAQVVKEGLEIMGGIFAGRYVAAAEMKAIATIPSRAELYGQLVCLLNLPLRQLALTLDQIAKQKQTT